jgi:hypothetical protein
MSNLSFSGSATSTLGALTVGGDLTVDNVDAKASAILSIGANAATTTLNLGTNGNTQAINMGTGSGVKTITIGGGTDDSITINGNLTVAGTTISVNSSNATIVDKVITLNKGGAAASGALVGLEIEEAGSAAGAYLRTNATRDAWVAKAPNGTEVTIGGTYTASTSNAGIVQVGAGLSITGSNLAVDNTVMRTLTTAGQYSVLVHPMECQLFSGSSSGVSTGILLPSPGGWTSYDGLGYYANPAQYSFWRKYLYLAAGNYKFRLQASTGPDRGIFSLYLDGTTFASADLYAGALQANLFTFNMSVATTGVHVLELRTDTKNASSSSYFSVWQFASFISY